MAANGLYKIDTGLGDGPPRRQQPPAIAAAFCVIFDARKGYTIAWKQSIPGVELEGVVEYKSLPSGLHTVEEDLVYFVYENYAGISAFLNKASEQDARGARMLATGVLVPIQDSRMGQSWLHAEGLKELVARQIGKPEDVSLLEEYWAKYRISDDRDNPSKSADDLFPPGVAKKANGYQKTRAMSDAIPSPMQGLSQHHPALALPVLFKTFGPLIFPLYRAALLRKRILLVGEAPVEINCDFVYGISILSTIQKVVLPLLPVDDMPDTRLRPLFNVGIQDIPILAKSKQTDSEIHDGWIACTTDDVLATKPELFDVLVLLPPAHSKYASAKIYPRIIPSSPDLTKKAPKTTTRATQRDARRFLSLRSHLRQFSAIPPGIPAEAISAVDDGDTHSVSSAAESTLSRNSIVEPASWSQIAYTSLLWWASAGEKRSGPSDADGQEAEQDAQLLGDEDLDSTNMELTIVSYFHRLTNSVFGTVSNALAKADGDDLWDRAGVDAEDEGEEEAITDADAAVVDDGEAETGTDGNDTAPPPPIFISSNSSYSKRSPVEVEITSEDLTDMGLDIWSAADRAFVEELVRLWWGREAIVKGGRVECCGVRVL